MEDSSAHTIRACLKEFPNTHQDKFEKGGPSPKVINLTQTLTVKNPTPLCYLEVSDYAQYILLGHITLITVAAASHCHYFLFPLRTVKMRLQENGASVGEHLQPFSTVHSHFIH